MIMISETNTLIPSDAISLFSSIPGVTTLIQILQTVGILIIVYVSFLFIKGILQYKRLSKLNDIEKILSNINTNIARIEKKFTNQAEYKRKNRN